MYLKRKWPSQERLQLLYTSKAASWSAQTTVDVLRDGLYLFIVSSKKGKRSEGKCWIPPAFLYLNAFTNMPRKYTKARRNGLILVLLSFNITDINITTQNRSLTCLHDSPGVGGSDGLNVSKPSASGGQAKPDLGNLLSQYQPQSKTGPATAKNLRS